MKPFLFFLLLFGATISLSAQNIYRLTLDEVIELARSESPDIKLAETRLNNNFWRYRSILADFKPQIQFNATLPDLNRAIESIILPNGQENFISRALMRNSVGINLFQPIAATGGNVFLFTGLQRLDIFKNETTDGSISYLSTPISIG
ncbi:MAG: hypothetical protein AAFU67_10305, partial [Bacteroidota bacterium]